VITITFSSNYILWGKTTKRRKNKITNFYFFN